MHTHNFENFPDSLRETSYFFCCKVAPRAITASSPEKPITPVKLCSTVTSRNDTDKIITTLLLSLKCTLVKNSASSNPPITPPANPKAMDVGIVKKRTGVILPPLARPVNAVNSTITNTSSTIAPAIIIWGILFCLPYPPSISFNIFGTTTAGETAAITVPIMSASSRVIPNKTGARISIPIISKQAGTKHIRTAGRPTFFKSLISILSPARVKIIISAICLKSVDIFKIAGSSRFST